jgi:hypothetical protein
MSHRQPQRAHPLDVDDIEAQLKRDWRSRHAVKSDTKPKKGLAKRTLTRTEYRALDPAGKTYYDKHNKRPLVER